MNYQALLEQKSRTARGLNIASLVFTILCVLSLLGLLAAGPGLQQYMEDNKSSIVVSTNVSQNMGSSYLAQALFDVNLNGNNVDTTAVAKALSTSANADVAAFANFLDMTTTNNVSGIYDFLENHTYDQFMNMKHAMQNLSDADIQSIVSANPQVTADQLKTLRDTAAQVPDEGLSFISRYMGAEGSDNLLQDSISMFMGIFYFILTALLILNLIVLVGCILGIVYSRKAKKNTVAFVFAIICAVLCFCEGAIVRCILFIISAVNLGQSRRIAREAELNDAQNNNGFGGTGGNGFSGAGSSVGIAGGTGVQGGAQNGVAGNQATSGSPSVFSNNN